MLDLAVVLHGKERRFSAMARFPYRLFFFFLNLEYLP